MPSSSPPSTLPSDCASGEVLPGFAARLNPPHQAQRVTLQQDVGRPLAPARRRRSRGPGSIPARPPLDRPDARSEEHTSELQSLMRISSAVFCLKKKNKKTQHQIYKQLS